MVVGAVVVVVVGLVVVVTGTVVVVTGTVVLVVVVGCVVVVVVVFGGAQLATSDFAVTAEFESGIRTTNG